MKNLIISIFLLLVSANLLNAQVGNEIPLSKNLNETRMGLWQQKDYKVYILMEELEVRFRNTGSGYLEAIKSNGFSDSVKNIYLLTGNRFLKAADQLKNAENGFDLRKLAVYYGAGNELENAGNSFQVETLVIENLQRGQAVVYKNKERIYTLKHLYEGSDKGITGTDITIYHDSTADYIFKYYHDYGW